MAAGRQVAAEDDGASVVDVFGPAAAVGVGVTQGAVERDRLGLAGSGLQDQALDAVGGGLVLQREQQLGGQAPEAAGRPSR